ncbi:MAG: response regulator [Oceanococcus sp.]
MQRNLPIPVLLAILLGCMGLVLTLAFVQTTSSVKSQQRLVELSEQRIAIQLVSSALRQNLFDLQSAARQYASLGEHNFLEKHDRLLSRFRQRRDLLSDPAPSLDAGLPNLHDQNILRFIGHLTRADVGQQELKSLRLALDTIVDMGLLQSQLLKGTVEGKPSPEVLLSLSQPARENLARQLDAHIASTRNTVETRIAKEKSELERHIKLLQIQQLILLLFLGLLILLSFIAVHRYVTAPLSHLVAAAASIGGGQYNTRAKIFGVREVTELATTLNWMADSFQADLEARERAERRAQRTERRLRQINHASPGVLWEIRLGNDRKPQLSFVGGAFENLYSVARVAAMSNFQSIIDCVHPEDRKGLIRDILQAGQDNKNFTNEHRTLRPDGAYRWIRAYGKWQQDDAGERTWTGFSVDIQELVELSSKLEAALAAAETGNRSKTEFLATLSHEIRTPMNAILGMSHLALQTDLNPRQAEYMRRIDTSSRMLLRIINDILDVSKIDAGRMELECLDFSLEQLLDNVNDVISVRAQEKNLHLKLDIGEEVPRMLTGDSLRLGQVLINLLGNAIKFTELGHVKLTIQCLQQDEQQAQLLFEVEDTGVGVAPDMQSKLFEAFTQADSSTTREYGGTGLGLTISKQLIELMGGKIQLQSELGKGSTFSFEVSLDVPYEQLKALSENASSLGALHCLVVDDSRSARKVIVSALAHFGFSTKEASNGQQCLDRASKESFDLILLDWRMPDTDGLEIARKLRRIRNFSARIIIITSYGREQLMHELEGDEDIDGVLLKPVSSPILLDTIAAAMRLDSTPLSNTSDFVPLRIPDLSGQHILLVEDNDIGRELMEELLEATHARISMACTGEEALAAFSEGGIDLIMLDLRLPGLSGQDTAKAIREELEDEQVPILALSADSSEQTREFCLNNGFNDFIVKPIEVNLLYERLAEWLDSHPTEDTLVAKPQQALPHIDGINSHAGLGRASYNKTLYLKLLHQLCDNFCGKTADMSEHLQNTQWGELKNLAHSLKGAASNLGAVRIAEESRDIEQCSDLLDHQGCQRAIDSLSTSLDDLKTALNQFNPAHGVHPASQHHSKPLLTPKIRYDLLKMIQAGDASARTLIQRYRAEPGNEKQIAMVQKHLEAFDFEKAAKLLGNEGATG